MPENPQPPILDDSPAPPDKSDDHKFNDSTPKSSDTVDSSGAAAKPIEEVDIWWGSYSGWTMAPSWILCIAISLGFLLVSLFLVPPGYRLLAFVATVGAIWLVQLWRWLYRVLGFNYRLTNRRLYIDRGWHCSSAQRIDLGEIDEIAADSSAWQQLLKLGTVTVKPLGERKSPILLEGVHDPERIAKQLRNCIARYQNKK